MNKTDIMVGDWVQIQDEEEDPLYNKGWLTTQIYDADDLADIINEGWKPIPITKEILEKNGFKVDMYFTLQLGDGKWLEYYHHEHRLREWWKGIDEWHNHSEVTELVFQCHVTYVHELQHALRLCKIDKEIEL